MSGTVSGLASKPYPRGRVRPDLDLPQVVCEYVDVFLDELLGLPPQRVVDLVSSYTLVLHPSL